MAAALLALLGLAARLSLAFQMLDSLPPAALDEDCMQAVAGDRCHRAVTYALERGVAEHPEWYPEFQRSSSKELYSAERDFSNMQELLHNLNKAGCGRPCPPGYVPPARAETKPEVQPEARQEAQPEVQTQVQTEVQTAESTTPEPVTENRSMTDMSQVQTEAQEAESTTPEPMTENRSMTDMSLESLSKYLDDPRWRSDYEKEHPEPHWREEYEVTVATVAALEREEYEKRHPVSDEVANTTDEVANATALESVEATAPLPEVASDERAEEAASATAPLPEVASEERPGEAVNATAPAWAWSDESEDRPRPRRSGESEE